MSGIAELGVAKRLAMIVVIGAVGFVALTVIGTVGQRGLAETAEQVRRLTAGQAALNHLDTRQSELKVDAYRSALGQDVSCDVVDDVASAEEAVDAVRAANLPADLAADFDAIRPDVAQSGTFISDFVRAAGGDRNAVVSRLPEIAERNNAVDDQLGALNERVGAADRRGDRRAVAW